MVASTEWEAISQAFFFGSTATGMGMQGGGPPCPGPGRAAPVAEGGPASPPGHLPLSGRHARHLLGLLGVPAPRPEVGVCLVKLDFRF